MAMRSLHFGGFGPRELQILTTTTTSGYGNTTMPPNYEPLELLVWLNDAVRNSLSKVMECFMCK